MDEKFLQESIDLLTRKGFDFDTEILNSKTFIYIFLDEDVEVGKLIEIWNTLDTLDWTIWKGWTCQVDVYKLNSKNVIEFSVVAKKTYAAPTYNYPTYYTPPTPVAPTTTKKPETYKKYSFPNSLTKKHRFEITHAEKNRIELDSIREEFQPSQIDLLSKTFEEVFLDDLEGPLNYKQWDYYYWRVKEFGSRKCDIEVEKFRGALYLVTITSYPKYSTPRVFKCNGLANIDLLIKEYFDWIPF
jgi:hypothetical protein